MKANEMESGSRNKGRQALQEFQGSHHDMGGSIAVRRFQLKHHLPGRCAAQSFVPHFDASAQDIEETGRTIWRVSTNC